MHKCIRRARGEPRDPLKSHAGRSRPHCGCGQILRATCRVTSLSDGRAPSRPHAAAWGSSTEWRPRALKTEKVDSECNFSDIEKFQNTIQKPKLSALEDGECLKILSGDIRRLQPDSWHCCLEEVPRSRRHCCLGRRCPEALALLPRKKERLRRFLLKFQSSTLARVFRGGELGEQVQTFRIKYTVRAGDTSGVPPVVQSQDATPLVQILSQAEKCLSKL